MKESEICTKVWKVQGSMGEKMLEGVTAIENIKYRKVKDSLSTFRKRNFPGGKRGFENPYYKDTYIIFDETTKTITIESPSENAISQWAGELELNLYAPFRE